MDGRLSMQRLPSFFVVGTVRGGTTWLHTQLKSQSQVFMCEPKEPHYYSQVAQRRGSRHVPHVLDAAAYRRLFAGVKNEIAIGDASTSYLWSDGAAERIRRDVPAARIIAVLRDPVDRAFSHYLKDVREGVQTRPFYEAVRDDWKAPTKRWETADLYIDLGLYHQQVKRYLDIFGADQVMVLTFGEIRKIPEEVIRRIAAFLGIDAARFPPPGGAENAYARPANAFARELLRNQTLRRAVRVLPYALRRSVKHTMLLKTDDKPALDRRSVEFLAPLFADDLARLRRLLDRPLPELSRHLSLLTPEALASHAG
jgi:Sulfotransferase family